MFVGGWVGWVFLLHFVVFFMPKSVVFIIFSFPSTFTNSFHTLRFSFLFFRFRLGLALLCWLAALVGLGTVGGFGSCFWLGMWLGWLFKLVPCSGLGLGDRDCLVKVCNLGLGGLGIVGGLGLDSRG